MMPGSSTGGGTCLGMPDVCQVPAAPSPVPSPFPNTGQCSNATQTSTKVMLENKAAIVENSEIPNSSGDEAGVVGGLTSGTFAQKVVFKKGSSKVMAEGKAIAYISATTAHNGSNANMPAGLQVAPSQTKVLVTP